MRLIKKLPDQVRELRQTNSMLWMIALGHTFTHWCPATLYLLVTFLVKKMGLTYSQADFLVTIRAAATLLINIPAGVLVDLIGCAPWPNQHEIEAPLTPRHFP